MRKKTLVRRQIVHDKRQFGNNYPLKNISFSSYGGKPTISQIRNFAWHQFTHWLIFLLTLAIVLFVNLPLHASYALYSHPPGMSIAPGLCHLILLTEHLALVPRLIIPFCVDTMDGTHAKRSIPVVNWTACFPENKLLVFLTLNLLLDELEARSKKVSTKTGNWGCGQLTSTSTQPLAHIPGFGHFPTYWFLDCFFCLINLKLDSFSSNLNVDRSTACPLCYTSMPVDYCRPISAAVVNTSTTSQEWRKLPGLKTVASLHLLALHYCPALVARKLSRYDIAIAALSGTRLAEEKSLNELGAGHTFQKDLLSGQHVIGRLGTGRANGNVYSLLNLCS